MGLEIQSKGYLKSTSISHTINNLLTSNARSLRESLKARLHKRFFSQQLDAIFVAAILKLQL